MRSSAKKRFHLLPNYTTPLPDTIGFRRAIGLKPLTHVQAPQRTWPMFPLWQWSRNTREFSLPSTFLLASLFSSQRDWIPVNMKKTGIFVAHSLRYPNAV